MKSPSTIHGIALVALLATAVFGSAFATVVYTTETLSAVGGIQFDDSITVNEPPYFSATNALTFNVTGTLNQAYEVEVSQGGTQYTEPFIGTGTPQVVTVTGPTPGTELFWKVVLA